MKTHTFPLSPYFLPLSPVNIVKKKKKIPDRSYLKYMVLAWLPASECSRRAAGRGAHPKGEPAVSQRRLLNHCVVFFCFVFVFFFLIARLFYFFKFYWSIVE